MMRKLLMLACILIAQVSISQIDFSRNVIASAGSEMSNASLQISSTVGEAFTATLNPASTHTLGFQQGDLSVVSIHELNNELISVFPNPADEQISITSSEDIPFRCQVYDVTGRLIYTGESSNGSLNIDVHSLVEGKYLIEFIPEFGQTHYLPFITIH